VHIGFHRARFRGARRRDYVIAGFAWHASILATPLRAKFPHFALKSPRHQRLRINAVTTLLRRNSPANFTRKENALHINGNPSAVGSLILVNQNACHVLFMRANHAD
jgi:hypothetical protein